MMPGGLNFLEFFFETMRRPFFTFISFSLLVLPFLATSQAQAAAPEKNAVAAKTAIPAKVAGSTGATAAKTVSTTPGKTPANTPSPAGKKEPQKQAAAGGPPAPGWELQQWHRMAGRIRLVSTKYGGKFETTHYTLLKPLPGDKMYFLNQQTKRYVNYTAETWRKKFNFYHKDPGRSKDSGFTEFSPWKRLGDEKIAGLKCGRFSRMRTNNLPAPNDKTYTEEWSFCKELTVPPALIELYKKTLYLQYDAKLGFPMRVREIREWNGKHAKKVELSYDTLKYNKASFPQSFFEMGKDYKQVKDEMSVLMDEGGDMLGGDAMGADGSMGGLEMNEELKRRLGK